MHSSWVVFRQQFCCPEENAHDQRQRVPFPGMFLAVDGNGVRSYGSSLDNNTVFNNPFLFFPLPYGVTVNRSGSSKQRCCLVANAYRRTPALLHQAC